MGVKRSEPLLTVEEIAAHLSVPKSWVYAHAATGRIPSVLVGRYRRFDLRRVLACLEAEREAVRRLKSEG